MSNPPSTPSQSAGKSFCQREDEPFVVRMKGSFSRTTTPARRFMKVRTASIIISVPTKPSRTR